jgi:hypothetical protein
MKNTLSAVHALSWPALLLATAISAQQPGTLPAPSIRDEEAAKLPYTYSIAGFEDQGAFTLWSTRSGSGPPNSPAERRKLREPFPAEIGGTDEPGRCRRHA